jgi:hypothetical protein
LIIFRKNKKIKNFSIKLTKKCKQNQLQFEFAVPVSSIQFAFRDLLFLRLDSCQIEPLIQVPVLYRPIPDREVLPRKKQKHEIQINNFKKNFTKTPSFT